MKKIIALFVFTGMLLFTAATARAMENPEDSADVYNGWTVKGNDSYYYNNGQPACGLTEIDHAVYYFDENGKALYGLIEADGNEYYFDPISLQLQTGEVQVKGTRMYFASDGKRTEERNDANGFDQALEEDNDVQYVDGFAEENGKTYFYENGVLIKDQFKEIDGNTYYFGSDGMMFTYTNNINGNIYFFGADGKMLKGFRYAGATVQYYDKESGIRRYGMIQEDGIRYYLTGNTLVKNDFVKDGKYYYYFNDEGKAVKGWQMIDGKRRYFSSQYNMFRKGFYVLGADTYYFGDDGNMYTYTNNINGKLYYFGADGKMYKGFRYVGDQVSFYDRESGERRYGIIRDNGNIYCLNNEGFIKNQLIKEGKYYYYLNGEGRGHKGWLKQDGKIRYFSSQYNMFRNGFYVLGNDTYYFGDDGNMYTYLNNINGETYYFGAEGKMYSGLLYRNNQYMYFGESGKKINGFVTINNDRYYIDKKTNKFLIGWQVIDGIRMLFNREGKLVEGAGKLIIDISQFNGNIDWQQLKQSVDGIIIKAGYLYDNEDPKFRYYVSQCQKYNIPFGIYVYSYALNEKMVEEEIQLTLKSLKGLKVSFPVFIDMEDADGWKNKNGMPSNAVLVNICKRFCDEMIKAGYQTGIYANLDWFQHKLNSSKLDNYQKWVAQWNTNDGQAGHCDYNKEYRMWQYTSNGSIKGISGRVDVSAWFDR